MVTEASLHTRGRHVCGFGLQRVYRIDPHLDEVIVRPAARVAVNHDGFVELLGQVDVSLVPRANVFAEQIKADERAVLGSQVFAQPDEVDVVPNHL
ncbi:MAG: hypothetical protein VX656_07250 [Candidatus Latescibacterota bacterium]|nr:hypothetical protein [Candidatus Latescibacterota bacterium]